jgi:hypothetical protein
VAAAGRDRSCPFDLHALLPVPDPLLRRGPDNPASLAWLRRHWGVVHALRHVRMMPVPVTAGCGARPGSRLSSGRRTGPLGSRSDAETMI